MTVDKAYLKELIVGSKDNSYLLNLYKIYELCNKVTGGNISKERKILDNLEDKIYTIRGTVLTQKERIILELNKVLSKLSSFEDNHYKDNACSDLSEIISIIEKCESSNVSQKTYDLLKEKIVIIEAKLNIQISFLYSGSIAFLNIYESAFINNKVYNDYDKDLNNSDSNKIIKKGDTNGRI